MYNLSNKFLPIFLNHKCSNYLLTCCKAVRIITYIINIQELEHIHV